MYKIRKETLKALSKLAFSVNDETRQHLFNTVRIEIEPNEQLIAVATNGHWLIKFNLQDEGLSKYLNTIDGRFYNYQPGDKFNCKKSELNDTVEWSKHYLELMGNVKDYPKWRAVIPKATKGKAVSVLGVNLAYFETAAKIIKSYAPDLRTKLTFYGNNSPLVINSVGNDLFMALIMPLRL